MIRSIYVDGLRSLREFHLELEPGLNVLVGPNGAGKSNILAALELVSILSVSGIRDIGYSIHSMKFENLFDLRKKDKSIHIILIGELNSVENGIGSISFKYEFQLEYKPEKIEKIFYSKQLLEMEMSLPDSSEPIQKLCIDFEDGKTRVDHVDETFFMKDYSMEFIEKYFNNIQSQDNESFKFNSIIRSVSRITNWTNHLQDELLFNHVYDIEPKLIRHRIEEPASPFLSPTGLGLLPTLWEIIVHKSDSDVDENQKAYPGYNYQDIYNKIICYFKQLSPEVKNLIVEYNDYRNKYEAEVLFENGDKIPLEQMSDGTMKWLYLITALLLSPGNFLLESPERFIHLQMQQQFIELTRSVLSFRSGFALISTHSETILNKLDAEEMIISYFKNDRTYANRIKNLSKLEHTLRETGFRLGQYYALGTLDYKSQE